MSRAGRFARAARASLAAVALSVTAVACVPSGGAPPAPTNCQPTATTSAIFNSTNSARTFFKLPTLRWNGQLACLARGWSSHMGATGAMVHRNLDSVIRLPAYAGFRTLGENILYGPTNMTAKQMHDAWMKSPGHRANILNRAFNRIGIGVAYARGRVWATENFGG